MSLSSIIVASSMVIGMLEYMPRREKNVACVNLAAKCSFSGLPHMDWIQNCASVLPPPVGPYSETVSPFSPVKAYSGAENPTPSAKACAWRLVFSMSRVKSTQASRLPAAS
jgi:hypothetical protein